MELDLGKINGVQYSKEVVYDDVTGSYLNTGQEIQLNKNLKNANLGWVFYICVRESGNSDKSSSNLLFVPKWFNENRVGIMACSETKKSNPFFFLIREENGNTKIIGRNEQASNWFVLHKIISI